MKMEYGTEYGTICRYEMLFRVDVQTACWSWRASWLQDSARPNVHTATLLASLPCWRDHTVPKRWLTFLEFAESLQHISKSIEHYAFLICILCTHCGLFYYDDHFPYKESQCSTLLLAKILQTPVKCYTKKTVDLFFCKIFWWLAPPFLYPPWRWMLV